MVHMNKFRRIVTEKPTNARTPAVRATWAGGEATRLKRKPVTVTLPTIKGMDEKEDNNG